MLCLLLARDRGESPKGLGMVGTYSPVPLFAFTGYGRSSFLIQAQKLSEAILLCLNTVS
jgi:hypothetical protein